MISFNFKYLRPSTIKEAVDAFSKLTQEGQTVIYYGGGTEIVTFARKQVISPDAVIDIKAIEECRAFYQRGDKYIYGAALTLNEIIEGEAFPLFGNVLRTIADHTVRNRLTLGGNICGRLPYRETVLPLLLADAEFLIAGEDGIRVEKGNEIFDKRINLKKGEFLVQVSIDKKYGEAPHYNLRRVKQGEVDYPLLHIAMLNQEGIKAAFSGVCAFPFRSDEIDSILNASISKDDKISAIVKALPTTIKDDQWASSGYRKMLFEKALDKALSDIGGESA